jgi:hypothetical protein
MGEQQPTTQQQPTEQQPTEQQPTEQQPTEQQPTEQQPTEQQPTEQQPTEQQPAQQQPAQQQPAQPPPPLPHALRGAYYTELDSGQRAALLSWLSFTATFAGVRGLTWSIRAGKGPFRNVSLGGEHLHHYMWGIAILTGVGAVAVRGEDKHRRHPSVAVSYGGGLALIVDEFALLLDLKDVYWARQGRVSVDLGVGAIALAGSYFAGMPVLRRVRRDRKQAR